MITTAVVLFIGLLVFLYFIQGKMIFFPMPLDGLARAENASNEIVIAKDGVNLHGWFLRGEVHKQKSLLVYYGGNAEEVSGSIELLKQLGVGSYLLMNYRGYGDSEGQPSETNLLDDALYILDYIRTREGIEPSKIVLMGRSLGTGVASYVASKRQVRGVILVSPFDSLANLAKHHYPFFPVQLLLRHRFDSFSSAPKITSAAVTIIATEDRIVPPKLSQNLTKRWGGNIKVVAIDGANHNNIHRYGLYWSTIRMFLDSLSAQGRSPAGR